MAFDRKGSSNLTPSVFSVKSPIASFQHGFIKGSSTVTNHLEFIGHVFTVSCSGTRSVVVYAGLIKAFNVVVSYNLMIFKL